MSKLKYNVFYRIDKIAGEAEEESMEITHDGCFVPLNDKMCYLMMRQKLNNSYYAIALDDIVFKDIWYTMIAIPDGGKQAVCHQFHHELVNPFIVSSSLIIHPNGKRLFEEIPIAEVMPGVNQNSLTKVIQWIV